jgi:hypothetical protein
MLQLEDAGEKMITRLVGRRGVVDLVTCFRSKARKACAELTVELEEAGENENKLDWWDDGVFTCHSPDITAPFAVAAMDGRFCDSLLKPTELCPSTKLYVFT